MLRGSRRRLKSLNRTHGLLVPALESLESRRLLAVQPYVVTVTDDSLAAGTLRSAILAANQDADPNPFDIVFNIPASSAQNLNAPVPGFDPITQTWKITLNSPLPMITHAVSIDGFSQANNPIPYPLLRSSHRGRPRLDSRRRTDRRHVHAKHFGTPTDRHDSTDPIHGNAATSAKCTRQRL